ncbi:MAG: S1C family serine protease [Velocimicrobium sp.]
MSNEEKQELQMNDEKRAFIREQIAPKRRSAAKRFMGAVWKTSILAILFGVVGSFVFCAFHTYFNEIFEKGEEGTIVFVQPTQSPQPTAKPVQTDEKKEPEQVQAVMDIDTYKEAYGIMKDVAKEFNHSVVTVSGVQNGVDWFDNPAEASDVTCGVIIADSDKKMYILTSYREITDVSHIQVTFENNEMVEATLLGKDKDTNIAVIAIEHDNLSKEILKKMQVAILGDSYYAQTGAPILALGNPNGYMYSMEIGMITGDSIEQYVTDSMVDLVSTNIVGVDEGDGVIVDLEGNIIGIITHQFKDEVKNSMCTAIAVNRVKTTIERIMNKTQRAYFGVVASNIPEEYKKSLGAEHGIYVMEVLNNSPALDAGIQVGDIITDIDDTEITSISNFSGALSVFKPKEEVLVKLLSTTRIENKEKTVAVVMGKK